MNTIREAADSLAAQLKERYGQGEARSITRIVFEDALGISNLKRTNGLSQPQQQQLGQIARQLLQGEPVQYVLGQADFYGLKFGVSPAVLIPRQETEELVHWILEAELRQPLSVLDVGTGSGCIPITLKRYRPEWSMYGADVSPEALTVARKNADTLGAAVEWQLMNALQPADWEALPRFDVIVSNPPYIPPSEAQLMPGHVLQHEPRLALFTDTEDALVFYRTIAERARKQLVPGGRLYFELNEFNAPRVMQMAEQLGFQQTQLRRDLNGKYRMLRATYKAGHRDSQITKASTDSNP